MAELFTKFEVNKTPWWPRIAHLVGGSCALHLVLAACVLYIPGLRSAFNIAGEFRGAGFVNEDYDKTLIGERAQMIEFPHERFQYPEGYFSNGEQPMQQQLGQNAPIIVQQYATPRPPPVVHMPRYRAPRQVTPRVIATASPSPQPSPSPVDTNKPATSANKDKKPEEKLSPAELEAEKKLDQIAAKNGIKRPKAINKKPFLDWLNDAKKMKDQGEINLDGTIEMIVEAEGIDAQGKLVEPEINQKTGDPKLAALAKSLVSALSDSGALDFLGGTGHVLLSLSMNETDVTVSITTEMNTEKDANDKANAYSLLLTGASLAKSGGEEAATIYKNTKVSSSGKQIILSFNMPRQTASDMLKKQLPTPTS